MTSQLELHRDIGALKRELDEVKRCFLRDQDRLMRPVCKDAGSTEATAELLFQPLYGGPYIWSHVNILRSVVSSIRTTRSTLQSRRWSRMPNKYRGLPQIAAEIMFEATSLVRAVQGSKAPVKAVPIVKCSVNEPPRVFENDEGGVARLSINWHRSIRNNGIAILEAVGGDNILTVSAKRKPSVFLADVGVSCFEVVGMRLGIKARRVEGYAFAFQEAEKRSAFFHADFLRGAALVQRKLQEAVISAFEVQ